MSKRIPVYKGVAPEEDEFFYEYEDDEDLLTKREEARRNLRATVREIDEHPA